MPEYIFTNLPQYIRVTPRTDFANSVVQANHVLLFSEDGSTLTGKLPDGSFITIGGSGGTDVSDTTATASTVLSGYNFYDASGVKTGGSIQTVTASASGNVVTVPAGYIASAQTLTIGTAVAAQTITPGTADQTIAADSYLSGAATIKGDANLIAANIASGVTIFGVTGTAAAGATNFYKCASVDTVNSTWTGYKAVLSGGVYSFESTVTSGLTYSVITPAVGGVYADGALIRAYLYQGWQPPAGAVFYAPLSASANTAETGQTLTTTGSPVFAPYLGIPSAQFSGSDVIESANTNIPYSESPFSVSLWVNIASNPNQYHGIFSFGSTYSNGALIAVMYNSTGIFLAGHGGGYGWDNEGSASVTFNGTWKHLAVVFGQGESGSRTVSVYINGTAVKSGAFIYDPSAFQYYPPQVFIGAYWGTDAPYDPNLTGYLAAVRVYNRALSASEITTLAAEFTPSAGA